MPTELEISEKNLAQAEQARARAESKMVDVIATLREEYEGLTEATIERQVTEDAAAYQTAEQTGKYKKLSKEQIDIFNQVNKIQKERGVAEAYLSKLSQQMQETAISDGERRADLQRKIFVTETRIMGLKQKEQKLMIMGNTNFQNILKVTNLLGAALSWLVGILVGEYKRNLDAIEKTTGVLESELGPTFTSARDNLEGLSRSYKLSSETLLDSIKANRQTVNAMGGTRKALDSWASMQGQFAAMTGNVDSGFRLMVESMTMLRKRGIAPTNDQLLRYGRDVQKLASMTNLTTAEINSMYDAVASDTDSMVLLKAAREDERDTILASQRALINMNIAAGMTAEQAQEAAKMLNKMVAAKPLDRLKQAARVRALGAAMGVGGGEEAAKAIMAGPRATAEQKAQLAQFSTNMTNVADQMRGAGLGAEIFSTTLLEKLNLEQYYGENSSFSTTLAKSLQNTLGTPVNAVRDAVVSNQIMIQQGVNYLKSLAEGKGFNLLQKISDGVTAIASFFGAETAEQKQLREEKQKVEQDVLQQTGMGFIGQVEEQKMTNEQLKKQQEINERALAEQTELRRLAKSQLAANATDTEILQKMLELMKENNEIAKKKPLGSSNFAGGYEGSGQLARGT